MGTVLRPAAPPGVPERRAARWLALCGVVLVALAGTLAGGAWVPLRWGPDTVMVLDAAGRPAPDALRRAASLLRQRLAAAGYGDPRTTVTGARTVTVRVGGGADPEALHRLVAPGRFSVRTVLAGPVRADPPAEGEDHPTDPATDVPGTATDLPGLAAKLGPAYPLALRISDPSQVDDARAAVLAPFRALTRDEVALLSPVTQYAVPAIGCDQLGAGPDTGPLTACRAGADKYLLDVAGVANDDLARATVVLAPRPGWAVALHFTDAGRARYARLVDAVRDDPVSPQVVLVVDHAVVAAPELDDPGTAQGFLTEPGLDQPRASELAALLGTGPLPVVFTVRSTDN